MADSESDVLGERQSDKVARSYVLAETPQDRNRAR
jgi:hypothetical protein